MSRLFEESLLEAEYEGLRFPVSDFSVSGGHDFAVHRAYLRDGADIETTGRKPYTGSFTIPLYNASALVAKYGTLFPELYQALLFVFEEVPLGSLTHQTHGTFTAHLDSWEERVDAAKRNGLNLVVHWTEHNAQALVTAADSPSAPASVRSATLLALAELLDAALNAAGLASMATRMLSHYSSTTFAQLFKAKISFIDSARFAFSELEATFNFLSEVTLSDLGQPELAPASNHAARVAAEDLLTGTFSLRGAYMPGINETITFQVPSDMPLWQIALQIYGSADQVRALLSANFISDPSIVRAGTVILAPPRQN